MVTGNWSFLNPFVWFQIEQCHVESGLEDWTLNSLKGQHTIWKPFKNYRDDNVTKILMIPQTQRQGLKMALWNGNELRSAWGRIATPASPSSIVFLRWSGSWGLGSRTWPEHGSCDLCSRQKWRVELQTRTRFDGLSALYKGCNNASNLM